MSIRFSTKLCGRKEPERGCLAKITSAPPKGSSPILHLPSEIRACIFNYILGDVDLIYRCTRDFKSFQCVASWSDYKKKLSFLHVCKLFQAEAWTLIQIKSVTFDKAESESTWFPEGVPGLTRLIPEKFGPQEVPLPLSRVRPHLREIRLSPMTLVWMLETDFLSTFPKLQQIRVTQRYSTERRGTEFRQKLDDPLERQDVLDKQLELQYSYYGSVSHFDGPHATSGTRRKPYRRLRLREILNRATLVTDLPVILDAITEYNEQPSEALDPVYPVLANVLVVKLAYEWRVRRFVAVNVDMCNQPMEMAVKSKYSESIPLTKGELSGNLVIRAG